jgi:hypothetical protein
MMQINLPTFLSQLGEFKPPVINNWNNAAALQDTTQTLSTFEVVISSLLTIATTVGGLLFLYTFIMGALGWITAGGDSGKITKARDQMVQGAIGLVILVGAYAIIGLIGAVLGLSILTPADIIENVIPLQTAT